MDFQLLFHAAEKSWKLVCIHRLGSPESCKRWSGHFLYLHVECNWEFTSARSIGLFSQCRKVNLFEDSDNNVHLKNLSLHQASNEEEGEKHFYQKLILTNFNEETFEITFPNLEDFTAFIANSVEIFLQQPKNLDLNDKKKMDQNLPIAPTEVTSWTS